MMSASEFFDFGAEPPWLVDACEGEVVSVSSQSEFFGDIHEASSSSFSTEASLEMDAGQGTEEDPMDFDTQMDIDEDLPGPGPIQNFEGVDSQAGQRNESVDSHFVPVVVNLSIESPLRQSFTMLSAQHNLWQGNSNSIDPASVAGNRFARPAPAADHFLRAFKRQKFAHLM